MTAQKGKVWSSVGAAVLAIAAGVFAEQHKPEEDEDGG